MSDTPSKVFSVRIKLRDFAIIWSVLEKTLQRPIEKGKVLSTLTKLYAKNGEFQHSEIAAMNYDDIDRFLRIRGFDVGGEARKLLNEAVERDVARSCQFLTPEEESIREVTEIARREKSRLDSMLRTAPSSPQPSTQLSAAERQAPATTPKLTAADLAKRQAATLAESAKLDKQINQDLLRNRR